MRLKDKVIIVTGGASGIGGVYARALANEGGKVVVVDVNGNEARETAEEIESQGGRAIFIEADVSSEQDTEKIARITDDELGQIDVLVNNAAMYRGIKYTHFENIPISDWERMLRVNLIGSWLCCRAVFPYMKEKKQGKIINISSSSYFVGASGLAHYVSSKAAVIGLTRALCRELGEHNITINCLAPGYTLSEASKELNPGNEFDLNMASSRALKRQEYPQDLIGTMIYLCSADSDFLTGQTILVDGGRTMH